MILTRKEITAIAMESYNSPEVTIKEITAIAIARGAGQRSVRECLALAFLSIKENQEVDVSAVVKEFWRAMGVSRV